VSKISVVLVTALTYTSYSKITSREVIISIFNIAIMSNYKQIQLALCKICESEEISVNTLREKIKELSTTSPETDDNNEERSPLDILRDEIKNINPEDSDTIHKLNKYNFFHKACCNPNVTHEVIEYIAEVFPGIETVTYLCNDILE